jgi:hypothetical protein
LRIVQRKTKQKGNKMTLAPNETVEQYKRKIELRGKMDDNTINNEETQELLILSRNAVSHLSFSKVEV